MIRAVGSFVPMRMSIVAVCMVLSVTMAMRVARAMRRGFGTRTLGAPAVRPADRAVGKMDVSSRAMHMQQVLLSAHSAPKQHRSQTHDKRPARQRHPKAHALLIGPTSPTERAENQRDEQYAAGVRESGHDAEQNGVPDRSLFADQVSGNHRLAVSRLDRVRHTDDEGAHQHQEQSLGIVSAVPEHSIGAFQ